MSPSDSIEATAPTIDQAISQALEQLGAQQDDVVIEVLSTPRSGVLGFGARPAHVRVTRRAPEGAQSGVTSPPPAPPRPPRREPPSPARAIPREPPPRPRAVPPEPPIRPPAVSPEPPIRPRSVPAEPPIRSAARPAPPNEPSEPSPERREREPRRNRRSAPSGAEREQRDVSDGGRASEARAPAGESRAAADAPRGRINDASAADGDDNGDAARPSADRAEQAREATNILTKILELMGEQATIEEDRDGDPEMLELNVKGDGSGLLIGRHGQTLDALEYLINRMLARKIKEPVPVAIDTEAYRARRRSQLQRLALSKGEEAKREHVVVTLEPMPPRDRRIIHLALQDDPMITTRSAGEGFLRAITIVPVDERRERGGREAERGREREPLGQQGGFKHGQKRIV